MEKYIKYLVYGVVFLIGVMLAWSLYAPKKAEATYGPPKVDICHNGETINIAAVAALYHLQHHEGDYRGACEEEPVDTCESEEGIQENGCTPEPTCEELENCPVEEEPTPEVPPVVPEEKFTPKKPAYSQGPHGVKGDSKCQLEWRTIKGSKKVEIRYAEDGVFGNGYKSFTTKDDGAEWLNADEGKVKIRGRDSKTEWSHAKNFSC